MANVRIFAEELLVVGALCSLSVAGCAGGGMPTAPTASPGSVTAVPLRFTGSETVQAAEGLRKKPDNSFAEAMPDADAVSGILKELRENLGSRQSAADDEDLCHFA